MIELLHCDCMTYMATCKDKQFDLVVTDPPYFLPVNCYVGARGKPYKKTVADMSVLKGYFEKIFIELDRITKDDGTFYVFCDAQSYPIFYQVMYSFCKHVRTLIWDKKVSYNGYTWKHQHEIIAWGERNNTKRIPTGDGDILKCRGVLQKDRLHPAEKPVELLAQLILKSSNENDLIIDPFMGSASVMQVCLETNRNFVGCEIDKDRYDTAVKRFENHKMQ